VFEFEPAQDDGCQQRAANPVEAWRVDCSNGEQSVGAVGDWSAL